MNWRHVLIADGRAYVNGVMVAVCVVRILQATARRREPCSLGGEWIA